MVIVMVASHACVIWAINLAVYKRARERDSEHMEKGNYAYSVTTMIASLLIVNSDLI